MNRTSPLFFRTILCDRYGIMKTDRRSFIRTAVMSGTALSGFSIPIAADSKPQGFSNTHAMDNDAFKLSIFSKCMHWLDYSSMAQTVAGLGFDGVDLTVRPAGHVVPERVTEDLPKAFNILKKEGLGIYMITTAIQAATEPHTEAILKTAAALGIKHYRMGWLQYDDAKNIDENLNAIESQLRTLAELNAKYRIIGEYQNHSGTYFGAAIWDLHTILKKINSPWLGSQYDILHATVEGANSWPIGLKLIHPFIKSIDIKDFLWENREGKWVARYVPMGEGMVDYTTYLKLIKQYGIKVPISVHFEFPLGGAEHGANTITISKEQAIASMKADLVKILGMFKSAGILKSP